jgi:hypothetical protein
MRSAIAIISGAAMFMAQMSAGFAQSAVSIPAKPTAFSSAKDMVVTIQKATVSPAIVAAFKAFPKGGEPLTKRIADIIAKDPNLAAGLVKYMQTEPGLTSDQKRAAERGFAEALTSLGIMAADMPVKALPPPAEPVCEWCWLLALAALAGIICLGVCQSEHQVPPPVSPH